MEGMDEDVNERQKRCERGEGDDEVILKKQKFDSNNTHVVDMDMIPKPSYAHVLGEKYFGTLVATMAKCNGR